MPCASTFCCIYCMLVSHQQSNVHVVTLWTVFSKVGSQGETAVNNVGSVVMYADAGYILCV